MKLVLCFFCFESYWIIFVVIITISTAAIDQRKKDEIIKHSNKLRIEGCDVGMRKTKAFVCINFIVFYFIIYRNQSKSGELR